MCISELYTQGGAFRWNMISTNSKALTSRLTAPFTMNWFPGRLCSDPSRLCTRTKREIKLRHKAALPTCSPRTALNTSGCKTAKSFGSTCSRKCVKSKYAATAYTATAAAQEAREQRWWRIRIVPRAFAFRRPAPITFSHLTPSCQQGTTFHMCRVGEHVDRLHFDRFIAELVQTA